MSISFWHHRFTQQARWTESARSFILAKLNPSSNINILEIGSGTGAVLNELATEYSPTRYGIDLNLDYLTFNASANKNNHLFNADGMNLPFKNNFFDITYCHYLLLWNENPLKILEEMKRTTKRGGWVCLFAEPDYLSRIDFPESLELVGKYQNESLELQGVRLNTGRNLKSWLLELELDNIHWGIFGAHQSITKDIESGDQEWSILESDLKFIIGPEKLNRIKFDYLAEMKENRNLIFIPTFYAYGQKY